MAIGGTDLVYNFARGKFATGQWNWNTLAVTAALVSSAYVPSPSDTNISAIPGSALLSSGVALTNLTVSPSGQTQGVIPQYTNFTLASAVQALVLYDSVSGTLIYYTASGIGFPFTPNGGNYVIAYDQVLGGFFQV